MPPNTQICLWDLPHFVFPFPGHHISVFRFYFLFHFPSILLLNNSGQKPLDEAKQTVFWWRGSIVVEGGISEAKQSKEFPPVQGGAAWHGILNQKGWGWCPHGRAVAQHEASKNQPGEAVTGVCVCVCVCVCVGGTTQCVVSEPKWGRSLLFREGSPLWSSWSPRTDFHAGKSPSAGCQSTDRARETVLEAQLSRMLEHERDESRVGQCRAECKNLLLLLSHFRRVRLCATP